MADSAARREARRRRILENSENRMQKIFGTYNKDESSVNEDVSKCINKSQSLNLHVENCSTVTRKNTEHLNNTDEEKKIKEKSPDYKECDSHLSESQYSEPNVNFSFKDETEPFILKSSNDCDNINLYSTKTLKKSITDKKRWFFLMYNVFFNQVSCILLALFVNILLKTNWDLSLFKGILMPYIILAATRIFLENKSEESQGNNLLFAALMLCNVKPEVIYSYKRIFDLLNTISRDFALYLTSFVLLNFIISIFWTNSNVVQFY